VAFDVAARLAEGAPALADFENYVGAAHVLGYQNPDLTMHAAQLRDLYGTEGGLDLRALEADADALSRLASLADEALRAEGERMAELVAAWRGQAADSAREFIRRHQDSAAAVTAAVHRAAGALSALRDQLWRAVDAKVDTVRAIDGRCGPARAEWLAAAHTVLGGDGDRAAASEVVDQRVRPFVEGDIASDWVSAMHASTASVAASYDTAIAALKPDRLTPFEVPGRLGPTPQAPQGDSPVFGPPEGGPGVAPAVPRVDAQTVPAAAGNMANPSPALAPDSPTSPSAAPAAPESPTSSPGLGDLGAGAMPTLGAGMAGLGRQLSDGIAGLTGTGRDAVANADKSDNADKPDKPGEDRGQDERDVGAEAEGRGDEQANDGDHATLDTAVDPADSDLSKSTTEHPPPPAAPLAPPTPPPVPSPEPPPTDLAPGPPPPARTPCEIAAEEVPQVGE
jgi:hypothetical protein